VLLELDDSEEAVLEVTVRTGTEVVGFVAAGAATLGALVAVPCVCAPVVAFGVGVAAGVLAGVEVAGAFVGVGVAAGALVAGVVAEVAPTPGGGANTAAPATPGTASASTARPARTALKVAAWKIGGRIGLMASGPLGRSLADCGEDTACKAPGEAPAEHAQAQAIEWPAMAPKQRQIRMEQRGGSMADIQALEQRSDEELETEVKYKSAAMAILGGRAAERFDAEKARAYFQRAIAAARPQERMQIRRMADASLALGERRPDALKDAVQRLGQAPPSGRQMFALRAMGLLVPPASAGIVARLRGILLIVVLVIVLLALGLGVVELISLPFGGLGIAPGVLLGLFLVIAVLAVVALVGRRRRDRATAARAAG
jgi:hypothetical protein